jgi:hypothetical protein
MASETFYSPKAPVRWAHLINADEYEGKFSYSCELVLSPATDPKHKAFLAKLEAEFVAQHGAKKARSAKGEPWRADKEDATKTVVRFKANRFTNDDGTHTKGPRMVDAKKQPWDGQEIGNGSELIIGFTVYAWNRSEGCGVTLQPRAVQVVTLVPREDPGEAVADGFDEQEGGYVVGQATEYVDEFADEEAPF